MSSVSIFNYVRQKPLFSSISSIFTIFLPKYRIIKKPYFLGFFHFPHFLSQFDNFYRKGRVNDTIIYFDASAIHLRHLYNRYTLSVKYCCHLKCKISRHTKKTPLPITISNDALNFNFINAFSPLTNYIFYNMSCAYIFLTLFLTFFLTKYQPITYCHFLNCPKYPLFKAL